MTVENDNLPADWQRRALSAEARVAELEGRIEDLKEAHGDEVLYHEGAKERLAELEANAVLHPSGRCGCCGEGRCQFCQLMAAQEADAETRQTLYLGRGVDDGKTSTSDLVFKLRAELLQHELITDGWKIRESSYSGSPQTFEVHKSGKCWAEFSLRRDAEEYVRMRCVGAVSGERGEGVESTGLIAPGAPCAATRFDGADSAPHAAPAGSASAAHAGRGERSA